MSWELKRLADICEIKLGKTPSRSDKSYWDEEKIGNNIWVSIADLTKLNSRSIADSKEYITDKGASLFKPVKAGTLLMSFKLSIGKLAYANCDLYTNEAIVALPIKDNKKIIKEFLYYFLQYYDWDKETENDVKLKGKTLNKAKLNEIKIPLPSLPTQQKIVAKLDAIFTEIDKAIALATSNYENSLALFQSYLTEVFEKIKDETTSVKFSQLATFRNGINFRTSSTGIPTKIFGVGNFKNYFFAPIGDLDLINLEKKLPKEDLILSGDILFVRSNGNSELIGRCVLFDNVIDEITFSGFTIRSRLISESVYPKFLMYFLKSEKTRRKMIDGGNGANIKSLNQTTLSSLDIPLPISFEIQKKITKRFEQLELESIKLSISYISKKNNLEIYKKSILQKAFNGELVKE